VSNSRVADSRELARQLAAVRGLAAACALSPDMKAAIVETALSPTASFRAAELSAVEPANGFAVKQSECPT
jgi:hypothetical protein